MNKIFPINFSIPEEKILTDIPEKNKLLSNLIPGDGSTYIYRTEKSYYEEYQKSLFATTFKKAGWDCMRHYEILANGCIPFFPDIEKCPESILTMFPKKIIIKGNKLFYKIIGDLNLNKNNYRDKKKIKDINKKYLIEEHILVNIYNSINIDTKQIKKEYLIECKEVITDLLKYTRENLTCVSISRYILDKTNNNNAKNVLFLSGDLSPDFLRDLTLSGFKKIFKNKCYDVPIIDFLYEDDFPCGFHTIRSMLKKYDKIKEENVTKKIEENIYDLVIYGSYSRGTPHYDLIKKNYSPDKIILLHGEDHPPRDNNKYEKNYVFIRELYL